MKLILKLLIFIFKYFYYNKLYTHNILTKILMLVLLLLMFKYSLLIKKWI